MRRDYEYIVLGLGGIGSAAAYWLARRAGSEVLGLEQFETGHVRGESQDHSRIIRLSYHTPAYVRLARQAYGAWAALEQEAQEQLVLQTGGLDLAPPNSAIPLVNYIDSMRACDVPFELIDAAEVRHRWPQFRLQDDISAVYQPDAGIVAAGRCNAAHGRMARAHGATLRDVTPVTSIQAVDGELEIVGDVTYRCRKLIIAAGPWTNQVLAHLNMRLPLTITQEQVTYFAPPGLTSFGIDRFPVWIWMDDPCFYGFPVYGEAGIKVGQDVGGVEVTADTRTFEPEPAALRRVEQFLAQYLPTALGPSLYTKTCLYTLTPDRDFVIDTLATQPDITIAIGAGHGFKFASLIGKILSELAIDGTTVHDIAPFRIDRPILTKESPTQGFMV